MANTQTAVQQALDALHWAQLYNKSAINVCRARLQDAKDQQKWEQLYGFKPHQKKAGV